MVPQHAPGDARGQPPERSLPGHYVSFAEWSDPAAREAWKQTPEFAERFGACAALCTTAKGSDFDLVVTV